MVARAIAMTRNVAAQEYTPLELRTAIQEQSETVTTQSAYGEKCLETFQRADKG